jgi:hypothetical protein
VCAHVGNLLKFEKDINAWLFLRPMLQMAKAAIMAISSPEVKGEYPRIESESSQEELKLQSGNGNSGF